MKYKDFFEELLFRNSVDTSTLNLFIIDFLKIYNIRPTTYQLRQVSNLFLSGEVSLVKCLENYIIRDKISISYLYKENQLLNVYYTY